MKEDTGRERREATNRKEEEETGNGRQKGGEGRLDKEIRRRRQKQDRKEEESTLSCGYIW